VEEQQQNVRALLFGIGTPVFLDTFDQLVRLTLDCFCD
jgi:hypothetical protein